MGCKWNKERYKSELIKLSKRSDVEMKYMIEQIIINTNFSEKDIYFLFDKFNRLESNAEGFISNTQLLELPEFKYCPFKKHLIRVFKLEKKSNHTDKEESEDERKQNSINYNQDDSRHAKLTVNKNNNFIGSIDKSQQMPSKIINKVDVSRRRSYIREPIVVGNQHIDFKKFCEIMKVFNMKSDVEVKIKCKFILLIIVYFDLYDVDGDGRISKKDLRSFLEVINTRDELDSIKVSGDKSQNDLDDYIDPIIETISKELITDKGRSYIDYREFSNLMWHTDIDKTCVIYLEQE